MIREKVERIRKFSLDKLNIRQTNFRESPFSKSWRDELSLKSLKFEKFEKVCLAKVSTIKVIMTRAQQ